MNTLTNSQSSEPKKGHLTEDSKDWDNPVSPEETEDQRDVEQVQRQMEEAKRRKDNLSEDDEPQKL